MRGGELVDEKPNDGHAKDRPLAPDSQSLKGCFVIAMRDRVERICHTSHTTTCYTERSYGALK